MRIVEKEEKGWRDIHLDKLCQQVGRGGEVVVSQEKHVRIPLLYIRDLKVKSKA